MQGSLLFLTKKDWWHWLAANHDKAKGEWLQFAKRKSGLQSVKYGEALEVALCFGWMAAQRRRSSGSIAYQLFTPRGPRSVWSKANRDKACTLIDQGRMQKPGFSAIQRAKNNGQWQAAAEMLIFANVPHDLAVGLKHDRQARLGFEALETDERNLMIYYLQSSRKAGTRESRLRWCLDKLAERPNAKST